MGIVFTSCSNDDEPIIEPMEDENIEEQPSIRFLALGDSYTIGQGVLESESWPFQLRDQLRILDFEVEETKVVARTGWNTQNLIGAIENEDLNNYNLVSLLIGVNNQYQSLAFETFQEDFDQLVTEGIKLAGSIDRVFILSIPDYGVTPFGSTNREQIAIELDMYNAYILKRCEERQLPLVNLTELSRELGDGPDALASDKLHPSALQYQLWVNQMLPTVLELLGK